MGKWCLHACSFIFDRIIIKVAGNQDRHKSSVEFDFGPDQTTHFGVTCPWVTKISHFWTLISLKPLGQSWSNFMCRLIIVGKWCLHASSFIFYRIIIQVAGNQDMHKNSDEFDFEPLVSMAHLYVFWNEIWPWHIGLRRAIVALWAICVAKCHSLKLSGKVFRSI